MLCQWLALQWSDSTTAVKTIKALCLRMCISAFTILLLLCKNSLMPEKHQSMNQPVSGAYKVVYIAAAMNLDEHTFYTCACLDIWRLQPFQEFMGSSAGQNLRAGHVCVHYHVVTAVTATTRVCCELLGRQPCRCGDCHATSY